MTDEEIEKEVREACSDLPDGIYDMGDYLTGKEGVILVEIEMRKLVNNYLCDDNLKQIKS